MSDKPLEKLDPVDRELRRLYPVGMRGGNTVESAETDVTIRKVTGFELFNTRRYHNYESWSDGWVIEDGTYRVNAEDLDDAVKRLAEVREAGIAEGCQTASGMHNGWCCSVARAKAQKANS